MVDGDYFAVAMVTTPGGARRVIKCSKRPTPREINLLYTLGEHVSRVMTVDDVCSRMRITVAVMRLTACRLRKKLHYDWSIDSVPNKGIRLSYLGSALSEAPITRVTIDREAVRRTRVQSEDTKLKIAETQRRKQSWRNFYRTRITAE